MLAIIVILLINVASVAIMSYLFYISNKERKQLEVARKVIAELMKKVNDQKGDDKS